MHDRIWSNFCVNQLARDAVGWQVSHDAELGKIEVVVPQIRRLSAETLARLAGEGGERSEPGEGGCSGRATIVLRARSTHPHPPIAVATGPSLSRQAGEGFTLVPKIVSGKWLSLSCLTPSVPSIT